MWLALQKPATYAPKPEIHFIAQDHSYTQEVSMHSVSTAQCERVCFSGGNFVDPVMSWLRGHQLHGHVLEMLPLLARHLLGLVMWYRFLLATFGGFSWLKISAH